MKGRIIVDIADDNGALFQVVFIKNQAETSSVIPSGEPQVEKFKTFLEEIKNQQGAKIIPFK